MHLNRYATIWFGLMVISLNEKQGVPNVDYKIVGPYIDVKLLFIYFEYHFYYLFIVIIL